MKHLFKCNLLLLIFILITFLFLPGKDTKSSEHLQIGTEITNSPKPCNLERHFPVYQKYIFLSKSIPTEHESQNIFTSSLSNYENNDSEQRYYSESNSDSNGDSGGNSKDEKSRKVDVKVTNISTRISPQFEFTLPSGNLYEHFVDEFNNLKFAFNLNYNFLNSSISSDITFKYPLSKLNPAIKLFMDLDFENIFYPQLVNNKLTIVPSSKYISRSRGIEIFFGYHIYDDLNIIPGIRINEIFKGNLTNQLVVDEGVDITFSNGLVLDLMRAKKPEEKLSFEGMYYRSQFDFRSRDRLKNYVSFENSNNFLLRYNFSNTLSLAQNINLSFPIKIWTQSLSSFYSLGGFNNLRGYPEDSIQCFRFLLLSSTLEKEFLTRKKISFKLRNVKNTIHQYRVFLLFDTLLAQSSLPIASSVDLYLSIGGGLSFVLSGLGKRHLKVDTYISQPLKTAMKPILYFKVSHYNLEKKL